MNRIIKFRAWTKRDKCWVGAFAVHMSGLWRESPNNDWTDLSKQDEIELMQFTGLFDKHGKEIYEGDILKLPKGDYAVKVVWDYSKWEFWTGDDRLAESFSGFHEEYEIIGNIYKNPNLIK